MQAAYRFIPCGDIKLFNSQLEQAQASTICTNSHPVHSHYLSSMKSTITLNLHFSLRKIQKLLLDVNRVCGHG